MQLGELPEQNPMSKPIEHWAVLHRCKGGWSGVVVPTKAQAESIRGRYESAGTRAKIVLLEKRKNFPGLHPRGYGAHCLNDTVGNLKPNPGSRLGCPGPI